jgi:hypothetical protein
MFSNQDCPAHGIDAKVCTDRLIVGARVKVPRVFLYIHMTLADPRGYLQAVVTVIVCNGISLAGLQFRSFGTWTDPLQGQSVRHQTI